MDEGWTRWVLENQAKCLFHASLQDALLRRGNLYEEFPTIIVPDQAPQTILNGYRTGAMPPQFIGGMGEEGVNALREFVEQGGTLIFLKPAVR